ncbi:MAG: amino acid--tRNA ligase-related protein [Spirochaetota bacterium]|nr:amino acid--tRNA ligase-related protein [Spirochaetota bacterium]
MEDRIKTIGEGLYRFQSAINEGGSTFEDYIKENYSNKWLSDELFHIMAVRTTMVNAMNQFLVKEGLFNLEKVMLSIITDPLAHDIEHTPAIDYKGQTYLSTHSMIYSKFLACSNPNIKGIFVDSPNIRLELESPVGEQRGRYLADFSQMDIEFKRNRGITLDEYYNKELMVIDILNEDMNKAKDFFERMIVYACEEINKINSDNLKHLGVVIEVPKIPFPSFLKDESDNKYGGKRFEEKVGESTDAQFFWVTGLLRENYDLVYPYLKADGSKVDLKSVSSSNIFNYDILAKTIDAKTNKHSSAKEILSGAIREWLYEPIIERIIDNKILPVRPDFVDGNIENINELGGYGPFLHFASLKDSDGKPLFPDTAGGGIGIERTLYALLRSDRITKIDDVTYFGKNPDSHPIFLY